MKDRAVALMLKGAWNMKLSKIGKIRQLHLDSGAKKISMEIVLRGESEPIWIEVERYEIVGDELYIKEFRSSKEWIEGVFENFLSQKPIKIPAQAARYLELIL